MPNEKKKYTYFTKALTCPDGSRKYIRGKTQKELDEKVRKARLELDRGVNINDSTTFGQFAQMWVDVYKRPYLRESSMIHLLNLINKYMMPVMGSMRMRDIKSAHIMLVMQGAAALVKTTQTSLIGHLRAIFNLAIDNQLISRSPVPTTLKATGAATKTREPLTPEECAAYLAAAEKKGSYVYTFSLLCLYAGLRASEARGLCWDCVDLERGKILVRRQATPKAPLSLTEVLKTESSRRDIPLHPVLASHLRAIKPHASSITVCGPLVAASSISRTVARLSANLGFYVHPHLLRHTYATRLVESGSLDIKEVQYLLGHSTPAMTLNIYAHYDRKSRESATAFKVANVAFTM